ncbi:nuclease-related domain-containing protein [Bacillus sp. USDA818B3_A]|uniref:nuclease-related domain-containing protein n=1 Tax=Bacillus sp. USDA818B3_A TaxID=2698834 RepID=UPI00136E105F|nr:nuclease-related domain-containing protein [Bacillus sp. USDA818B3_A]
MIFKERSEPLELKILRSLDRRVGLEEKEVINLQNLSKGYEGEVMFDRMTKELECPNYLLNDLFLEWNGSKFQMDTLMITKDPIYLFEVKNFEGDFYFENGRFYALNSKKEIKNPLLQLERCESLLRQFLQSLGYRMEIVSYVIFINPRFHLYQSPLNKPIIYPNQLPNFMKKLNRNSSALNGRHKGLAEQLASMHRLESPYEKYAKYKIDLLRKGLFCALCGAFEVFCCGRHLECGVCGHQEGIDNAVLRIAGEIRLLYPNERISTSLVYEWCNGILSKQSIGRVLRQNFCASGIKNHTYYY